MTFPVRTTDEVIAIDVLLEPDADATERAQSINAELRNWHPDGFALDERHRAHLTLAQCYLPTDKLVTLSAVVDATVAAVPSLTLTAAGLLAAGGDDTAPAIVMYTVNESSALMALHERIIDALAPLTVDIGQIVGDGDLVAPFVTSDDEPTIDDFTVNYVGEFVERHARSSYFPHITIGLAPPAEANELAGAPFEPFSFSIEAISIYQLGAYGTAQRPLHRARLNG